MVEEYAGGEQVSADARARRERVRSWLGFGLIVVVALGGTLLLYREALGLPFFFDDMIHLRWLDWHTLRSIWTSAEGLGYYRPLTMSVWKVSYLLLGYNDPQKLHLFNLLLHATNTVLGAWIAWRAFRGQGRYAFTLITAALFLSFPFSYQAVPSTSSLSKPFIATLVLASAGLYWEARRRNARWLCALSLLVGFLAPFAYETGVVVPLAIVAIEALGYVRREFERPSRLPILYMVLVWGVALPVVVLLEPETGASLRFPALLNLWQNAVYFGEGLVFPVAPLSTPVQQLTSVDEFVVVAVVNLLGLVGLWALYRWARQMHLFWYSLSWFVVGVVPLWLMLDFAYVITSPRLLYLGGLGSAMLWAGVPVLLWTRLPGRWWARGLASILLLATLAFSVVYVRQRMVLADAVGASLWQAAEAAEERGESASLLYVNVPAWVAPKTPTYRIGSEGLTFIPEYVRVQDSVFVNTGVEPEIEAYMFDPVKREWTAYIGYAGEPLAPEGLAAEIRQADAVYLMAYPAGTLQFVEAGGLEGAGRGPGDDVSGGAVARFGDQVLLVDSATELLDSELRVVLWWDVLAVPPGNVTAFLHVYDEAGQLVAQKDGVPLAGLFPPWAWQPGDRVRDVRLVTLPEDLAPGMYTVSVGWYNADSGERLPATNAQGLPVEQGAVRVNEFVRP